mmetsp:Transcript_5792/g.14472  ORF Transcript_5792/g.14472 Transcript_5792/m.14472 type:complete len:649 (-) Transcript_5792:24-1970(-)
MNSDSDDDTFDNLSSAQDRLMKEMNAYLAAISHSPGGDKIRSSETRTRRSDNSASSSDSSGSLSARIKMPSCADTSVYDDNIQDGGELDRDRNGGVELKKDREGRGGPQKKLSNLNSIKESGDQEQDISVEQYEYYNDFNHSSFNSSSAGMSDQFDDDSLVAMAKRMDTTTIVSDPSLIGGSSERTLALPQPKMITAGIKKLGQKINSNRSKPAQPPRSVKVSPNSPPKMLNLQMINTATPGYPTPLPFKTPETDDMTNDPNMNGDGRSTFSTYCPSSFKENNDFRPENVSESNGKNYRHSTSSGSTNSVEPDGGSDVISEKQLLPETKAAKDSKPKARIRSSSKNISTNEESRASRRGSGRKSRRSSSRKNTSPIAKSPGCDDSVDMPAKYMPAKYMPGEENAAGRKNKTKSKRKTSKRRSRNGLRKGHQRQKSGSDEESMQGYGCNTRIHDDSKLNSIAEQMPKEYHAAPSANSSRRIPSCKMNERQMDHGESSESEVSVSKKSHGKRRPRGNNDSDEESLQGVGFDTRIYGKSKDTKSIGVAEQIEKQSSDAPSTKKSHRASFHTMNAESQMDHSGSSEGESSGFSSDDQTQIFYESTDESDFDSEEELEAVGTSVADAVKDLNSKRAVTKVKNLFGIRGSRERI